MDDFVIKPSLDKQLGVFAIRGDLDGGTSNQDFSESKQYIGLLIGEEEFLLPIEVMNEIIMIGQLTFVPNAPQFIEGVINLRGIILPAINLRKMMGLENVPPSSQSRIIVAHHEDTMVGLIVDGITYVITLFPDQIQNQLLITKGTGRELFSGISKQGDQVNGILDIAKVIAETGGLNPNKDKLVS